MIVTSEYIFINPKLNEINDIIKNTQREHKQKYGDILCRKIEVKCNVKLLDETKNKTKKIMIMNYRGVRKTIVASNGVYEFVKVGTLSFLIGGTIYKNIYTKCNNIPILWKKFFFNIVNSKIL